MQQKSYFLTLMSIYLYPVRFYSHLYIVRKDSPQPPGCLE